MNTASKIARADFCFSRDVLANVDASDIAECFGLAPVVDDNEDLFDDLRGGYVDDDGEVFASVAVAHTVASRKR